MLIAKAVIKPDISDPSQTRVYQGLPFFVFGAVLWFTWFWIVLFIESQCKVQRPRSCVVKEKVSCRFKRAGEVKVEWTD